MSNISLREYQEIDITNIESAWQDYRSVIYQLPTGGGKSVVVSKIVSDYKKENILILAHKRRLLTQLKGHLSKVNIKAGLMYASVAENTDSNIVIASIRTVVKDARLEILLQRNWDRVIIDEARHSRTGSYDKVLDALLEAHPNYRLLGVDATPYRKDKKRLDKHFQYMVCSTENTASLIAKGYLSSYRTYVAPIGEIEEEVSEVANDYQQQQLSQYMRKDTYLNYVVDTYKQYGEDRQAIVFAVDIDHSRALKEKFLQKGESSVECIDSSMGQETIDAIVANYEDGRIKILINVEMLTEGVDLPDTGCVVGARPTKSLTLYLQMVGRGTRLKSDGSDLIVIDCCGWTEDFGQLSSSKHWSLNPEINPNNPRLNNKVLGKRKDGTYTEDLTDFIGEVVEMTPEEYLANVQGGLEKAEQLNVSIDDKILALFEAIYSLLLHLMKKEFAGYHYRINTERRDYYILFTDNKHEKKDVDSEYGKHRVKLRFGRQERLHAEFENGYRGQIDEYMKMMKLCGKLNSILLEDSKIEGQVKEILEQVVDLEKSKVNLDKFRNAAKQFTEDQWKKQVDEYCADGKVLTFSKNLRKDSFFKGWSSDKITGIKVLNDKVNAHHNTIELQLQDNWKAEKTWTEEKKYIKGEKVYDLLKSGEWKIEEN